MAGIQITGNAGVVSDPFQIGEDQLSFMIRGDFGTGGETVLEETEDDPFDLVTPAVWTTVPNSEIDTDGGFNMETGLKWLRVAISLGTGLDLLFIIKRFRTDGSVTR